MQKAQTTSWKTKRKGAFLPYIHNFRGIAILYIVAFHCLSSFDWGENILQKRICNSLVVYGTVLFVFIAGFLFQHLNANNNFNYKTYLKKKTAYVILPYIIASIPAILDKLYLPPTNYPWMPSFVEESNWLVQVGFMLLTGKHFGPFWFIPMVTLIYLLSPVLLFLDQTRWFYRFVFPLIFMAGFFLYRFGHNSAVFESFLYFLPIYIFGMWASFNRELILSKGNELLIPLVLIYVAITSLEIIDVLAIGKTYSYDDTLKQNAYLFNFGKFKVSALCIVFMLLLYRLKHIKAPVLKTLAVYSFGIFFVHLYIIRVLELITTKMNASITFNSLVYLIHISLIIFICLAIVKLAKVVTGKYSRFLIGC